MSGDSAQLRYWWQVDLEHKQPCIIIEKNIEYKQSYSLANICQRKSYPIYEMKIDKSN